MAPFLPGVNKIKIVGLITKTPFHRAKLCAQKLHNHFPQRFNLPEIRGMLEFDWDEYILTQRRLYGGQLWALMRPVAIYVNNSFIGSDEDFLDELLDEYKFYLPTADIFYRKTLYLEYVNFLKKSKRVYCYMDIKIDDTYVGTLIFQLYSDLLPETCENFRSLCTGEMGENNGIKLSYKGSQIHRIVKTCWIQGGDIENKTGGGGVAILSPTFPDEGYCIRHDRRGVLSMANDGKHSNASQFFITLQAMPWMDYYYVAFGQLVEGVEVLNSIEAIETYYETPKQCITISKCGMITLEEKEIQAALRSIMSTKGKGEEDGMLADVLPRPSSSLDGTSIILGEFPKTMTKELIVKVGLNQFINAIIEELITRVILRAQDDVIDIRDVPSLLDEERYFSGMCSLDWDPNFAYRTPSDFLTPRSHEKDAAVASLSEETEITEYYIEKLFSEESLPVCLPKESSSDTSLSSSVLTAKATVKELITNTIKVTETAKRLVNMILNDAMRMVRSYLNYDTDEPPEVLAKIAGIRRQVVNEIIEVATKNLCPSGDIRKRIIEELLENVISECCPEEYIVDQLVNDLITKAVKLVHPSLTDVVLTNRSALEVANALFSDTSVLSEASKDVNEILQRSISGTNELTNEESESPEIAPGTGIDDNPGNDTK